MNYGSGVVINVCVCVFAHSGALGNRQIMGGKRQLFKRKQKAFQLNAIYSDSQMPRPRFN